MPSGESKRHVLVFFFRRKKSTKLSILEQSKAIQSSTYNQAPHLHPPNSKLKKCVRNAEDVDHGHMNHVPWLSKVKKKRRITHFISHLQTWISCLLNIEMSCQPYAFVFLFTCLESGSWVLSYLQTPGGYKPLRLMKKWKKELFFDETLPK
jgi:hypothetical protein